MTGYSLCRQLLWSGIAVAVVAVAPNFLSQAAEIYPVRMEDAAANAKTSGVTATFFGFTPFPYDFTMEAVAKTHETIVPHSTLYALHYDNGVPWKEALADTAFPVRVQQEWDANAKAIPEGHVVYVGLAPLDKDRKSLAPATGEKDRVPMPEELRGVPLDDANVKKAYLNYARRAVKQFRPRYLNLGIEAGQIMSRDFTRWPQFERLYEHVRAALKEEFPDVQIGISFGLGGLRAAKEAEAAKALIARSDYVGVSFYPYGSPFDEKFGAPPYGGEKPWREPLAWLRAYTDKPLAICETGYTTQDIDVPQFGLKMQGSPAAQTEYVRELFETRAVTAMPSSSGTWPSITTSCTPKCPPVPTRSSSGAISDFSTANCARSQPGMFGRKGFKRPNCRCPSKCGIGHAMHTCGQRTVAAQ